MTLAEYYKKMAADLRSKARREESEQVKSEWESLADCYSLLANRASDDNGAFVEEGPILGRPRFIESVV